MKNVRFLFVVLFITTGSLPWFPSHGQWHLIDHTASPELFLDVFFLDENNGYILGMSGQTLSNFVLKTIDGGLHLDPATIEMSSQNPLSMFFTDEMKGYMSSWDKICKTRDGGLSWTCKSLGLSDNAYVSNLYFYDDTTGYASAMDIFSSECHMVYTHDAGMNWSVVKGGSWAESGSNALCCTDANTCYATGPCGERSVFKTTDGGKSWAKILELSEVSFNSVHFIDSEHGVIAGGNQSSQKIYRTIDGGDTWEMVFDAPGKSLLSLGFTDALHGFAVGNGGTMVATIDGGETWLPQESPTDKTLYSIHCPDANTAYAVGAAGTLLKYRSSTGTSKPDPKLEEVHVYFNYATEQVILELNSEQISNHMKLAFFNCLGKKLLEINVNTNQQSLSSNMLGRGVFFYQCSDRNKVRGLGKIFIY